MPSMASLKTPMASISAALSKWFRLRIFTIRDVANHRANKDALKREKPSYNIPKFRVNVAVRTTGPDTKDHK